MPINNQYDSVCEKNLIKITIFSIDSYITKPDLILDETYSKFRKANINQATVIRVFGSTDDVLFPKI
ncbi:hypothetical protein QR98_0020340 [Sarcoptes scabiei]|uniref:Uncharacterized protein n=1 Tax=Sarcoptes scabiei TaxID=52283 RepID=A0A131ZY44_SARSC|nr:hypothetical protein QR98_0020340 [Sarcoptes scabiei]